MPGAQLDGLASDMCRERPATTWGRKTENAKQRFPSGYLILSAIGSKGIHWERGQGRGHWEFGDRGCQRCLKRTVWDGDMGVAARQQRGPGRCCDSFHSMGSKQPF